MKNRESFKIGNHPAWSHELNGVPIYGLPDVGGDGFKFAVHDDDPSLESKYPNFEEFQNIKMQQVKEHMKNYFR